MSDSPAMPRVKRGRFAANLTSNMFLLGFNILLGLWLTPFFVHHLGDAGFGMIPLITTITGYMAVVTLGLNAAVGRYLTIAVENDDDRAANRFFNTSLFGTVGLVLLLVLPLGLATLHVGSVIEIPSGQGLQVRWLFACAGAAFLLNTLMAPFAVSTYCMNRFVLRNAIQFAQRITYALVIVLAFGLSAARLSSVGIAMVCGALVALCGAIWAWREITPQLRISVSHFNLGTLRELASTGGWVSLNTIGAILFLGVELVIVNRMFGPNTAGRYAAVMQWPILLRSVAATIAGVFGPSILYRFAQGDFDELVRYSRQAVKCLGLMMALPVGLVCGLSAPLLETWLGPEYVDLASLLSLMTIHWCVTLSVLPLFHVQIATNRVLWPGVVTLVMGAGNVALALLLAGPAGWGVYGVAAATCIMLSAKSMLFTPLYACKALHCKPTTFYKEILPMAAICLTLAAVGKFISGRCDVVGWGYLIAVGGGLSTVYLLSAYYLLLSPAERGLLWRICLRQPM